MCKKLEYVINENVSKRVLDVLVEFSVHIKLFFLNRREWNMLSINTRFFTLVCIKGGTEPLIGIASIYNPCKTLKPLKTSFPTALPKESI